MDVVRGCAFHFGCGSAARAGRLHRLAGEFDSSAGAGGRRGRVDLGFAGEEEGPGLKPIRIVPILFVGLRLYANPRGGRAPFGRVR